MALLAIFTQFQPSSKQLNLFHSYRILAHDGSDLKLPLNAIYNLLNRNFEAVSIKDKHDYDEHQIIIDMAEQVKIPAIFIADRGYRSLNVYEHLRKSGHYFMIQESDTTARNSVLSSLGPPQDKEFDNYIHFQEGKPTLLKQKKAIKFLS